MRQAPYYVMCGNQNRGVVWIDVVLGSGGTAPAAAMDPRQIAMHLRDELPIPFVTVRINPDRGLVGTESWFWIQGYGGAPLSRSTDAFGSAVEVDARVTSYTWRFGDGSSETSSTPGQAYPERSAVRHLYERSSADSANGYPIGVDFNFTVRYRVGGGSWIELPVIARTANANYPVRESQAVIQR